MHELHSMYEHNKDKLVYGILFYVFLSVSANTFLWIMETNTRFACT